MIPLYSQEQVRAADNYAISKLQIPGEILMENAAISIVEAIIEKYPYLDTDYQFGIVCGKGNNGGDGFAVARHLLAKGFSAQVLSLADQRQLQGDALTNFKILKNFIKDYPNSEFRIYKSNRDLNNVCNCEIIVDAILGTGATGELKEPINKIVAKLNDSSALRIAIDSPTGLNLSNASGEIIFNANFTVTLAAYKTGLFYEKGKANSGKVVNGSIGIGNKYFNSADANSYLIEPEDVVGFLPKKGTGLNKYSAGKVFVIGGSQRMPGAAIYAINSAMISGTGAGILSFPKSMQQLGQAKMNAGIVYDYEDDETGILATKNLAELKSHITWADVIALGPGLGREKETQEAVFNIIKSHPDKKIVIDADGITALNKRYKKVDLSGKVLTPHHKEFADLIGVDLDELKNNLLKYGRKFASETNSYLVLKGAPTIIFNQNNEVFINSTGNVGMAKFGSGDVLTGIIASLISQHDDIEESIIAATYLHSLSADLIVKKESEFGITPEKIIEQFPKTVKFLRKSIV